MSQTIDDVMDWVNQEAKLALSDPKQAVHVFWDTFGPGGRLHPRAFLESQGHLVIEALLLVAIIYLVVHSRNPPASKDTLTEKEVDDLCASWKPEGLVPIDALSQLVIREPVLMGIPGAHTIVDGKKTFDLATMNFWNLAGHPDVQAENHATIQRYGIGSCGPRGFYGTIDVHLTLEAQLTRFMGTEEAIIYSYDLATMPSVLPAFASRKDVIVMDEAACWPLRSGASLSRADVTTFKHNNMADLERVLQKWQYAQVLGDHKRSRKPLNRRFIVVEGIYVNGGDVAPLRDIHALKERYKFRLVVDETLAFGVLGETGRGACQHAGLAPGDADIIVASMSTGLASESHAGLVPGDADIIVASMSTGLASVGGFCVGSCAMVDHQRLSGSGYCFSASLPPFLAVTASKTLELFEASAGDTLASLQRSAQLLRAELASVSGLTLVGGEADALSPVLHLQLAHPSGDLGKDIMTVVHLRDKLLASESLFLGLHRPTGLDNSAAVPALKAIVSSAHTAADLKSAATAIKRVAKSLLAK